MLQLYDIADGKAEPGPTDPTVVFCMDEFGPLTCLPRPGKQRAPVVARNDTGSTDSPRRRRRRATYKISAPRACATSSMIAAAAGLVSGTGLAFGVAALAEQVQPVFVATIGFGDVAFAGATTLGMALLASFFPARPIARLHPAEVFRG